MLSTLQTPNPLVFETRARGFPPVAPCKPWLQPPRSPEGRRAGSGQGGGNAGSGRGRLLAQAAPTFWPPSPVKIVHTFSAS